MGFVSNLPNDNYRKATLGADNPAMEIMPAGMFSGTLDALGRSVVGAGASVLNTLRGAVTDAADATGEAMGLGPIGGADWMGSKTKENDALKALQEWAKIDPRTHGVGAQVAGSTVRGLTIASLGSLAGGPVGAGAMLGGVEGYEDYEKSLESGIDPNTALKKSILTGGAAAAGAFLPMKVGAGAAGRLTVLAAEAEVAGNTALAEIYKSSASAAAKMTGLGARIATGATINTTFGAANRWATSGILESAGYHDMAAQYKVLDTQAIVSDVILGAAFGAWGHLEDKLHPLERPDPTKIEAALEVRKQEAISRGAAGIPTDMMTAGLDAELQTRGMGDLLRGREVTVTPEEALRIVDGVVLDPVRAATHAEYLESANTVLHGLLDTTEPTRLPDTQPVISKEEAAPVKPLAPPPAEGMAKIDPIVNEQMQQMAARNPDLDVQLPDGRTVKASEMADALAEQLKNEHANANLIETAVGCFLRGL